MTEKLRAPFVWTPRQAIDPMGFRKHYLGAEARPNEKNRWFLFRKTVRLATAPSAAPLSITVDGRYVLYVNGAEQGRGPVRCSPLFQRYDDYDLAAAFTAGDNVIAVLVHTYGRDTAFYMGPEEIARVTRFPVFFVAMRRLSRGHYEMDFQPMAEAGQVLPSGTLTERYARLVEAQIQAAPADWPWSHKRWKLKKSLYAG